MSDPTSSNPLLELGQLTMNRQSPTLRGTLWGLVRDAKSDDLLAPVTVVAPSRYASLSLRQELALLGFANVRFIELPMLAELLGTVAALAGRRPLTGVLESIHLRQVLAQTDGPLSPFRDHRSTQSRLKSTFQELRRLDDASLTAVEALDGVPGSVARLYQEFRRNTGNDWYDVEDVIAAATDAVQRDAAPALADLGWIVFYLPRSVSTSEIGLLGALAVRGLCSVVLGTTGDHMADRTVREMSVALTSALGEARGPEEEDAEIPLLPGEAHLHVAPNTHEELRWVIRQMFKEAKERGTSFHRMAALYRMEEPYDTLIRDELRLAGLPVAGPSRGSLSDTAVGRTLTGLLELADGELPRSRLMGWLTGCPVRPPGDDRSAFNPSRWDSLSRQAGVISGLEQWRSRLGRHARQLTEDADRREAAEEITEARAYRMREEAATVDCVLVFVEQLAADLAPPAMGSSWSSYCDWAIGLLDGYLSHEIPDTEFAARERIGRALEELRGADSIRPTTTLEEFRQTISDLLGALVGHLGATGQGVFVSPFPLARGMSFDVVWLVGMIEGGTPPSVPPDPLLPEVVWQEAGGPSRTEHHIARERYDYLSAVASAPRRFLSYPVADASSQRRAHPSRWLLEQASYLEGQTVSTSSLTRLGDRSWLSVDFSAEQALASLSDVSLADGHDYQLNRLLQWRGGGEQFGRHPLVQQGVLARASRLGRSRYRRHLTEFDGNLSNVAGWDKLGSGLLKSAVSPTSLESWAACPFRYFLGHVLRLTTLETPDETAAITPLERGALIHGILERFVVETEAAGSMPAPNEDWGEEDCRRLMQVAEESFAEAESRGVTGKPLLWHLDKEDMKDDLITFLEEDGKLRMTHGTNKLLAEAKFGLGGDTPEVLDEATGLRFRGIIDRLDVSTDGKSAFVIDYKTGSNGSYRNLQNDPIDKGKRLQLGVYSLAARKLVPDATKVRAAYWFTTTRGQFQIFPKAYFDMDDEETAQRFRYGVSAIVEGIHRGVFPANPGSSDQGKGANCRFCDFDSLCPSRRIDNWEQKKVDSLVNTYRELAEDVAASSENGEQ